MSAPYHWLEETFTSKAETEHGIASYLVGELCNGDAGEVVCGDQRFNILIKAELVPIEELCDKAGGPLTVAEALAAYEFADFTIRECDSDTDRLDLASNHETAFAACPETFTEAQKSLVQQIILDAYMRSIGRA